jgi:nucleotide-binding universal stress UspA family protein
MNFHTKIILHPTDFSNNAANALEIAADFLNIPSSRLVILHVCELPTILNNPLAEDAVAMEKDKIKEANEKMNKYIKKCFGEKIPVPVPEKEIVLHGSPYKGILDAINRIDPYMVVIGQKGHSKIKDLIMGSTAKHLTEKVHCPLVIVPSFVSLQ